jgi:hypothetical protein
LYSKKDYSNQQAPLSVYWGLLDRNFLSNNPPREAEAEVENGFDTVIPPVAVNFGHIAGAEECNIF